jgi:hypothetical protein
MNNRFDVIYDIIHKFKYYQDTYPNLSNLWLSYINLKEKNYDDATIKQCYYVLNIMINMERGDLTRNDIISLLLYKNVML